MYQDALEDIDLAMKLGYPVKSRIKLIVRRSACEAELNKVIKNPKDTPPSESTAGSGNMERILVRQAEFGRGMFASVPISRGDLVLIEQPYISVLHPNRYKSYCYHCFSNIKSRPTPCQGCRQVRFCSPDCLDRAWTSYHETECCYLDVLNVTNDFHYAPKLTLRAIIKTGIFECMDVSIQEQSGTTELVSCGDYTNFCSLIKHDKEDTNDYTITVVILVALLLEKHPDHIFTPKTILSLSERIAHHLRQVNVNGISITSKQITDEEDIPQFDEHTIGCGVYLNSRFINHSCDPNTRITRFDSDTLVLYAINNIAANEEILFSYGGNYRWQIMSERKRMLKNSYFFDCQCSACAKGLQPVINALICPDCKGPVVADGPMVCIQCKKIDHIDLKEVMGNTDACLKMIKIGQTYLDRWKCSKDKIDLEAAEKVLKETHNSMRSIMCERHPEIIKVAEKMAEVALKLEKFDELVEIYNRIYESLSFQYDLSYYKVFNCLFKLVTYQSMLYMQLKIMKPVDRNRINILKTDSLSNLDQLEITLKQITKESTVFTVKIEYLRKLFFG